VIGVVESGELPRYWMCDRFWCENFWRFPFLVSFRCHPWLSPCRHRPRSQSEDYYGCCGKTRAVSVVEALELAVGGCGASVSIDAMVVGIDVAMAGSSRGLFHLDHRLH